ncbi:MAG: AbrB/MazE/SpoVT family DNA-binding domain-containing protein [Euryarchaeota archaeon]|nr:AbrB/MazE/SpoVT family DNA-binding domain-containing protein [Euryarchaeota archaeon]MBU4220467.1 AbrB/MazE/SpoVT family DNA-binding domain-containing protein [Euryarchaeota archaeon]MCG2735532.1 AbrB/MazE/SpoVT family DNA-binding domain-containing protein [Candidatus Methanoperedenaceae archaeon]MDP3106161.1 AbrB/MazE/SpoVT family DNA-binding domain-containing protein [Candidatus Methanoperedens sp.]
MTTCPICETPMKKEKRELKKGIFARVEICPKCEDEWIDEKGYEALYNLFTRKTFKIGGSLAVRIPKEIANVIGLKEGSEVKVAVKEKKIVIEAA